MWMIQDDQQYSGMFCDAAKGDQDFERDQEFDL